MGKFPIPGQLENIQSENKWLEKTKGHLAFSCSAPQERVSGPEGSCRACPMKYTPNGTDPQMGQAMRMGPGLRNRSVGPD